MEVGEAAALAVLAAATRQGTTSAVLETLFGACGGKVPSESGFILIDVTNRLFRAGIFESLNVSSVERD